MLNNNYKFGSLNLVTSLIITIKQGQKFVHKNVSQGCNLIKRL